MLDGHGRAYVLGAQGHDGAAPPPKALAILALQVETRGTAPIRDVRGPTR